VLRSIGIILILLLLVINPNLSFAQGSNFSQYQAERAMAMLETLRDNTLSQALDQNEFVSSTEGEGILDFIAKRLHPYGETTLEYNDNIYLLKNDRTHDFINRISPGVRFILGPKDLQSKEKNYIELDLGGNISNYLINQKANRSDPYGSLDASFGKGKHRINFSQDYEIISLPASLVSAGTPGTTDYIYNATEVTWESLFHRFGFDVRYFRENDNYIGDYRLTSSFDTQTANFSAFLIPEGMPKTRFLFEYRYDIMDYFKAANDFNDYYKNTYWLGVKGKLTGKITGTAKVGYETIRYRTGKEFRTIPVYGDLLYKYSRKWYFVFNAARELGTSSYINEGNSEYLTVGLSSYYNITTRLRLSGGLTWTKYKYGGGDERFIYNYPLKLEYIFNEWFSGGLAYKFGFVKSDNDLYKYANNVFAAGIKAEF